MAVRTEEEHVQENTQVLGHCLGDYCSLKNPCCLNINYRVINIAVFNRLI